MAESLRKSGPTDAEQEEARQKRRDHIVRVSFFIGMIVAVVLMILLSQFLSGG